VVAAGDKVSDVGGWPPGVDAAFLVDELLDQPAGGDDGRGAGAEFESVDAAVLFGPFGELEVGAFLGDLVDVAEDWEGGWTGWEALVSGSDEEDYVG